MAEEEDLTAAEYVLGTLDGEERNAFLARLTRDPAAVAAVVDWQRRLAPLGLSQADEPVPPDLWARIEHALFDDGKAANDNNRRVRGWRVAAAAASLIACVTSFVAWQAYNVSRSATPNALAALTRGGQAPVLVVTYDVARHRVRVTSVAIGPQPGHSLELWLIAGSAAPKSMGIVAADGTRSLDNVRIDPGSASFAVSVEPVGGSPTGAPTGPVIYSGKMLRITPEA